MKSESQLLPQQKRIADIRLDRPFESGGSHVVSTRDHDVIKRWASKRQAEPATGEATTTGPATIDVKDGGAGIRFNFPGASLFRPISWEEWFENFDRHQVVFVFENDTGDEPLSYRYRIVKADEWQEVLESR